VAEFQGVLSKMQTTLPEQSTVAEYGMVLGEETVPMQPLIGQQITLQFDGGIHCQACNRKTKKSFSGGFCFPCSQKLARCDLCFLKPETCHYAKGTCREPEWGEAVCMQDHIVYLANSSGLKVGITRIDQVPTRWIDQGATQALPIFRVKSRLQSGLVEVMFKQHVADKTDWRKMLKGAAESIDLAERRDELVALCQPQLDDLHSQYGETAIHYLANENVTEIEYPVLKYPEKVKSQNFDKTPEVQGVLEGIKGQYLIFDTGVLNIRKFSGYQVTMVV
jgi:hypothetical protein